MGVYEVSSCILKIIAMIAMFLDHMNYLFYDNVTWLNYVGRIAFPIFAWQIAVGFEKTRDVKLYAFRLLVLALISQPLFILYFGDVLSYYVFNTIFTLLLGLLCLCAIKKSDKLGIVVTILSCILAQCLHFDYGAFGIIMIVIFYLFRENKGLMLAAQAINLISYKFMHPNSIEMYCIVAFLLILLYNGKRGHNLKYLFYVFYPLHLLVLYILKLYIGV